MQPPRHALGALLLEQDRVEEAAEVYAADLAAHPGGNVWSLSGLSECQDRGVSVTLPGVPIESEENARLSLGERLAAAKAVADVEVEASCFCRLTSHGDDCCEDGCAPTANL